MRLGNLIDLNPWGQRGAGPRQQDSQFSGVVDQEIRLVSRHGEANRCVVGKTEIGGNPRGITALRVRRDGPAAGLRDHELMRHKQRRVQRKQPSRAARRMSPSKARRQSM